MCCHPSCRADIRGCLGCFLHSHPDHIHRIIYSFAALAPLCQPASWGLFAERKQQDPVKLPERAALAGRAGALRLAPAGTSLHCCHVAHVASAKAGFVLELSLVPLQPPDTAPPVTIKPLCYPLGEGNGHLFHDLNPKKGYFNVSNRRRSLANLSCPVLGGSFLLLQPSAVAILSHQPQS